MLVGKTERHTSAKKGGIQREKRSFCLLQPLAKKMEKRVRFSYRRYDKAAKSKNAISH